MNVMEFFEFSTGKWRSLRTTHHLPFRCAEAGESEIYVEALPADNPKVVEICGLHEVDPKRAIGGAFVSWAGQMGWDKEDENHSGSTVFALIPDEDDIQKGLLLRERGYAEIIPVAGQYHMDDENALVLTTEYETMSTIERFWFPSPGLRMRTSTVKRFGGFSTATFCTEFRVSEAAATDQAKTDENLSSAEPITDEMKASVESTKYLFTFGW